MNAMSGLADSRRRGADRPCRGDDPHVGAALRLPGARPHPSGYRLYSEEEVDDAAAASSSCAAAGCPCRPRWSARAPRPASAPTRRSSAPSPHEGRARRLRKRTLIALSRAIEDEAMARAAAPVVHGRLPARAPLPRRRAPLRRMARRWRTVTVVFADFARAAASATGAPAEVPITPDAALGHEWAVVVDAPGFAVCLPAWEPPASSRADNELDREGLRGALDAGPARRARGLASPARRCARAAAPDVGRRIEQLLRDRPLAPDGAGAPGWRR